MAEIVEQQQTNSSSWVGIVGNHANGTTKTAQSFKLSRTLTVTAVEVFQLGIIGSPTGNWELRIETDSSGVPSGTLAHANATVTVTPPADGNAAKGTFASTFVLSGSTSYHIVVSSDAQSVGNYWKIGGIGPSAYPDGNESNLVSGTWAASSNEDLYFKVYVEVKGKNQSYIIL